MSLRRNREWPMHLVIWSFILIELFPLYMMLQVSLKDNASFMRNPWLPNPPFTVSETFRPDDRPVYQRSRPAVWSEVLRGPRPLGDAVAATQRFDLSVYRFSNWEFGLRLVGPYIANSIFVSGLGTACALVLSVMGAYFFARYRMPFSQLLWSVFLLLMLLPGVANIVPLFTLLREMNLLNTLWALVIVGVSGAQVFNIYVLRNFIEDIPKDLFDAAEMDGAGHSRQIWNIVLPMSASIIGTLAILTFLQKWNEFLLPLIVLRDRELFTIGVGLIYLDGESVKQWGEIMAAYSIAALPLIIVFLFTMRLFVRGLSSGAIKG